jgi:hypothetical protein
MAAPLTNSLRDNLLDDSTERTLTIESEQRLRGSNWRQEAAERAA